MIESDASPKTMPISFPKWSLQTFLLAIACAVTWTAYWSNLNRLESMRAEVDSMQPFADELIVEDPQQISAIDRGALSIANHERWFLYLPSGAAFRLCLAYKNVHATPDLLLERNLPDVVSVPLESGNMRLSFEMLYERDHWRLNVVRDSQSIIDQPMEVGWNAGSGSVRGSSIGKISRNFPVDMPLELLRSRFPIEVDGTWKTTNDPCHGVLLWVELE